MTVIGRTKDNRRVAEMARLSGWECPTIRTASDRWSANAATDLNPVERSLRAVWAPPTQSTDDAWIQSATGCFGAATSQALPPSFPDQAVRPLRVTDPIWVEQYQLVSRLGVGATADVFLARAPTVGLVVLKLFQAANRSFEMFQREVRLSSAAHTAYTPTVLDQGVVPAGAYIVSSYLPGYDCATTLSGRLIGTHPLHRFATGLAHALAAIHTRGVVHCDVKPANLLARDGDVRLIDFGIARYVGQDCQSDVFVERSRGWAAPEQLSMAPATPAMDVFAWGCVMAFLAGGVHPFTSDDDHEWIMRVQSGEPDLYGLPSQLEDIVRSALARDADERPSARDLVALCAPSLE